MSLLLMLIVTTSLLVVAPLLSNRYGNKSKQFKGLMLCYIIFNFIFQKWIQLKLSKLRSKQ